MPAFSPPRAARLWLGGLYVCGAASLLVACGGGGGGGGADASQRPGAQSWVAGVFRPAESQTNFCAAPRTGIDPYTTQAFADKAGSTLDENHWLRSWTHDNYLWYDEVVDRNPALYTTPEYFALLKTPALTPAGLPKDRFHFSYPTEQWNAMSLTGESAGYGMHLAMLQAQPPRELAVVYTEPGSPAAAPGVDIARGARVLSVNAIDLVNENKPESIAALNSALSPTVAGVSTQFTILDAGASVPRTITLQSAQVVSQPVQNARTFTGPNGRTVGYLQFNDHIRTAEQQLAQAMEKLRQEGATELIVDLRYNSGGFLYVASQLAYMIAGRNNSQGRIFERSVFNDKVEASGKAVAPMSFLATGSGNAIPTGVPLPSLDLRRVYVLAGANTCSASESLINGLQGIDIDVVKIGATTCGKPYGFYPQANCGSTYFSVQFRTVNAKGFGDYAEGIAPTCSVPDDLTHPLGDVREARMAAALNHMATGACTVAASSASARRSVAPIAAPQTTPETLLLNKPEGLRNRILEMS